MIHKGTVSLETERLVIRPFENSDLPDLYEIMRKPEVMYAWEHGFSLEETQEWLKRQQDRFINNGMGEQAVCLKVTGALIGAAGFLEINLEGKTVMEIGYIFDNKVWGNGYATETAKALEQAAFDTLGVDKLYCTMRSENNPSIKVAERLGFKLVSEYVKVYNGKDMLHSIYILERDAR